MTLASLTSRMVQFLSYLYFERMWAAWELLVLAAAAVLLLMAIRQSRKAKPIIVTTKPVADRSEIIGVRLSASNRAYPQMDDSNGGRIAPVQSRSRKKLGWREATKKCQSFREMVEQLQREVVKYKQAEDSFRQQVVTLKAVNSRLEERLTGRISDNPELTTSRLLK